MVWVAAVGVAVTAAVVMGLLVPRVRIVDDEEAPDFGALVSRRSVMGVALAAFVVALDGLGRAGRELGAVGCGGFDARRARA